MRKSFETKNIKLKGEFEGVLTEQRPQEKGKIIHGNLARCINENMVGKDDTTEGKLLKKIEEKFRYKFLKAEVPISGYATKESEVVCYSGKMDAVAFRRNAKGELKVIVVDWKSYSEIENGKKKDPQEWWKDAKTFKPALYQCLLYRELLQAHLKENDITARVGVMIVPIPQARDPTVIPGLCMDFQRMDKKRLLNKFKEREWFDEQSKCFRTITLPSNLLNLANLNNRYVAEGTGVVKGDTMVKDIIKDEATIKDLCEGLGILQLKVRCERQDESSEAEATGNEGNEDEG